MSSYIPLADKLRPTSLADFYGQAHLLDNSSVFNKAIVSDNLHSMILWGPAGTGKTTLAKIIANNTKSHFVKLSAMLSGVKDIRIIIDEAEQRKKLAQNTILFIDEIHRFNKAQQDVFLPHVESGLIVLIGATTENPSFELNSALLSRVKVYILKKLTAKDLNAILSNALKKLNKVDLLNTKVKSKIVKSAMGDARRLLNILEIIINQNLKKINEDEVNNIIFENIPDFDKNGDIYYQQLSAFHKSIRGSSPDGALYWMARMLESGCSPYVIARRLLAIASEDIGNADPRALEICLNAWDIHKRVGDYEGNRAIAQAAVYCAVAAKSNAVYKAFSMAMRDAKKTNSLKVPKHLCNAPTKLMQELGYNKNYRYAHDEANAFTPNQTYFPNEMGEKVYYQPNERGLEIKISNKLKKLRKLNNPS